MIFHSQGATNAVEIPVSRHVITVLSLVRLDVGICPRLSYLRCTQGTLSVANLGMLLVSDSW